MTDWSQTTLARLLHHVLGKDADEATSLVQIDPALAQRGDSISRAAAAMALNIALLWDLTRRTPTAKAYVEDNKRAGRPIVFDHGALRTILSGDGAPTGALPPGRAAIARILAPLGYAQVETYPLDRLKMTGWAYRHKDHPETIPQFFVSELHVDRFTPAFQSAAQKVFSSSKDPLTGDAKVLSEAFLASERAPLTLAQAGFPAFVAAFGRQHDIPHLADYQILLAESAEAAWIATEGNVFNHATDRVDDVEKAAEVQRTRGRAVKDLVEVSRSGRVRQTAFKADTVQRYFRLDTGKEEPRDVPGSFFEFISRDMVTEQGKSPVLDLSFDSANAQGIFKMTAAKA